MLWPVVFALDMSSSPGQQQQPAPGRRDQQVGEGEGRLPALPREAYEQRLEQGDI